jgi:hypothetical protein
MGAPPWCELAGNLSIVAGRVLSSTFSILRCSEQCTQAAILFWTEKVEGEGNCVGAVFTLQNVFSYHVPIPRAHFVELLPSTRVETEVGEWTSCHDEFVA